MDIVYDPSQTARDLSIRLEMEIEEDWELDLETFSRLRRLGRFKEAKQHFKSRLEHLSTIPYLWLQYADMLGACGDYKAFRAMPDLADIFYTGPYRNPLMKNPLLLKANYELLILLWQFPPCSWAHRVLEIVGEISRSLKRPTPIGSTEVRPRRHIPQTLLSDTHALNTLDSMPRPLPPRSRVRL